MRVFMKLQIIYPKECFEPSTPDYYNGWLDEIAAMKALGLCVSDTPHPNADKLLYRSYIISNKAEFPDDPRYISRWRDYRVMSDMSIYLPLIEDITIPSFIVPELNNVSVEAIVRRGWDRAFVRSSMKSLKYMFPESNTDLELPVWPEVSMDKLASAYGHRITTMPPPYIIRQFMPEKVFLKEERFWILNHHAYHRSGYIPEVVQEAVNRLRPLQSPFYVIDATPDFVVEVNPGVSSDSYAQNIPHFFPKWIQHEFCE